MIYLVSTTAKFKNKEINRFLYRIAVTLKNKYDLLYLKFVKEASIRLLNTSSPPVGETVKLLFANISTSIFILYFISIFILLNHRKVTEALICRVSNYPDLLLEILRYCCPLVI